jgi:hypothetical protein
MTRVTFSSWRKRIQNGVLITAFLATASGLFCGLGSLVASAPELRTSQKSETFGAGWFSKKICNLAGYQCAGPIGTNSVCDPGTPTEPTPDQAFCIGGSQESVCISVFGWFGSDQCTGTQTVPCPSSVLHTCTASGLVWKWTVSPTQPPNPSGCGLATNCSVP